MQLFGFPSINKDGSSATKMEFYQKPESHQTQNSSSELKTLEPTIEGKRPRKQSITSKSNENNCPEIDIKQEIPSFDDDYDMKYECGENEENNEEIQSSYPDLALKEEEEDFKVQKKKRKKKAIITKKKREIITEEKENNQEMGENADDSYCAICERDLGRPQYLRRHMKFAHDTKRKPFR